MEVSWKWWVLSAWIQKGNWRIFRSQIFRLPESFLSHTDTKIYHFAWVKGKTYESARQKIEKKDLIGGDESSKTNFRGFSRLLVWYTEYPYLIGVLYLLLSPLLLQFPPYKYFLILTGLDYPQIRFVIKLTWKQKKKNHYMKYL